MKRGLVIGKFYPPHKGHHYLINTAVAESDKVDVLVCDSPKYKIDARKRADWLQLAHPDVTVRIIPDLDDDENSKAWADHTIEFLGYSPDVVFSSEDYGEIYAHFLGCKHRMVDRERKNIPISATHIRENVGKHWQFISHTVKKDLATRIVVLGAESTGTTTLSLALAEKLRAAWAPEIGRYYTKSLLYTAHEWQDSDFVAIASMQQQYEDTVAANSDGLVICDTNAFATQIWQERYMGHVTQEMKELGMSAAADLYIVTGDEIPFVQDGIRDGEQIRHSMHKRFIDELKEHSLPYIVVRGDIEKRVRTAVARINEITKEKAQIK